MREFSGLLCLLCSFFMYADSMSDFLESDDYSDGESDYSDDSEVIDLTFDSDTSEDERGK